jgi:hypothetical protein
MVLDAKSTRRTKLASTTKGSRSLTLPKSFTRDNGTEESTGFNDVTWSKATIKYMDFINNGLRESSFEKITKKAQEMIISTSRLQTDDSMDVDPIENAQLVDLSDDECTLFYFDLLRMLLTEILIERFGIYVIAARTRIAVIT